MAPATNRQSDEISWGKVLGVVASIVGVLAFAGIANYQDLMYKLSPQSSNSPSSRPAAVASTPAAEPGTDPEAVRWKYVRAADTACAKVTSKAAKIPDVKQITYDWMKKFLDLRREMLKTWQAVEWPESTIGPVDSAKISKIWSDFDDANQGWAAMAEDLRRKDADSFNRHRDYYGSANASFVNGANAYGFSTCNYSFASVGMYQ